jgi:valyl-tRNA synthetase
VLFGKVGSKEEQLNKQKLLVVALTAAVRLIHPMAPYITEELFQLLKKRLEGVSMDSGADPYTQECVKALTSEACIVAPYPKVIRETDISDEIGLHFDLVSRVVYTIRNIRGEMNLPPSVDTDVFLVSNGSKTTHVVEENQNIIRALVRTKNISIVQEEPKTGFACTGVTDDLKIIIPLPQEMVAKEMQRLEKEAEKLKVTIDKLKGQLNNEHFVAKAPEHLVIKQRTALHHAEQQLAEITSKLNV